MKVNVVSTKLIKPCVPTPQKLSKYKISFLDELTLPMNFNLILFYPSPPPDHDAITLLEHSLANILPQFYPLAGRYVENDSSVDCNDEGAEFVLAEATDIQLADLTTKNDPLNDLLSRQFYEMDGPTDPLLSIQITRLKGGELAIGISVSHRIFDASSLKTLITAWSNAGLPGGGNAIIVPNFDSPSLFPAKNLGHGFKVVLAARDPNIVVKRLFFSKEDIENLRSKIRPAQNGESSVFVSRVRLVSAFIAKALIRMNQAKYGKQSACYKIAQMVNMRERTIPHLPMHSCGNLVLLSATRLCVDSHEESKEVVRFEDLIYILGESIGKTITCIGQMLALGKEGRYKVILDAKANMKGMSTDIPLVFTDWSKFGFYEADFGWGKPVWVGFGNTTTLRYAIKLVDNEKGGGIVAWVYVNQGDLSCFERYVHMSEMESEDF